MTSENDFQARLNGHPGDNTTRLVLADFLEEWGDARADWYRVAGTYDRRPHGPCMWDWFQTSVVEDPLCFPAALPPWFYARDKVFASQTSRRAAEDAAARAFAGLSPEEQTRLVEEIREYHARTDQRARESAATRDREPESEPDDN